MGGLNIPSHSHTTDQMIRLDNPRLTETFLEFNGIIGALNREKKREEGEALLKRISAALEKRMSRPRCPSPKCGRPMVLRIGGFGPFFGCPGYPHCEETVNVPRPVLEAIIEEILLLVLTGGFMGSGFPTIRELFLLVGRCNALPIYAMLFTLGWGLVQGLGRNHSGRSFLSVECLYATARASATSMKPGMLGCVRIAI